LNFAAHAKTACACGRHFHKISTATIQEITP
jgi:hypothetical protein